MKIHFYSTAPSNEYKSWSNIPYLLQKNLEKRGYLVENHVMSELEPFKTIFNLPVRIMNKIRAKKTTYYYVRTPLHFWWTHIKSLLIEKNSNKEDTIIVQGFSYPPKNSKNRHIIIGDWPSEYLFEKFLRRKPSRLERSSIDRENSVIEGADAVVTLFPNVRDYMLMKYDNPNIYWLGNVVNIDDDIKVPGNILERKAQSTRLLFIGQSFYLRGANEIIAATKRVRQLGVKCEVDIIGIDPRQIDEKYEWLKVYKYLDKDNPLEKRRFYELLANARLFVNTTPGWSGFQALLEAMYFYTPIVVRPNEMLSTYFSDLSQVADIVMPEGPGLDSILIESLRNNQRHERMSQAARLAVESSTWKNFMDKLEGLINE